MTTSATRPSVYLVEDDEAVRTALTFALDLEGFTVRNYECGEAILSRRAEVNEGCLVIDECLPGLNGLQTIARLRDLLVDAPALLITTHPKAALRAAAAAAGVRIVEKPLIAEELFAAIRGVAFREV